MPSTDLEFGNVSSSSKGDPSSVPSFSVCDGSWASANADSTSTRSLIQTEMDYGWVKEFHAPDGLGGVRPGISTGSVNPRPEGVAKGEIAVVRVPVKAIDWSQRLPPTA